MFGKIEWLDVAAHIFGGALIVGGLYVGWAVAFPAPAWLPLAIASAFNSVFWFLREMYQRYKAGRTLTPLDWGPGKHAEWIGPTVLSPPIAWAWLSVVGLV